MIVIAVIMAVYFGYIFQYAGYEPVLITVSVLVLLILASFTTLTVMIDQEHLRIKFGYGIYSKSFKLEEIASTKAVKNHWYFGWGIRYWIRPRMWIFNVSGFDAVEINMKNGKVFRIGTDESEALEQAIAQSIK